MKKKRMILSLLVKKSTHTALLMLGVVVSLSAGSANANILYFEDFEEETGTNMNGGTTPETNPNGAGVLQSSGVGQATSVSGGDREWNAVTKSSGYGQGGLRFGATPGYNWASGANGSAILAAGGFSVSFNFKNWNGSQDPANDFFGVIVGSNGAGEEGGIDDINGVDNTFAAAFQPNGTVQTWENGVNETTTGGSTASNTLIEFLYTFNSFNAGSPVSFQLTRGGSVVATDTFTWDENSEVKIRLVVQNLQDGSGGPEVNRIDDLTITAIPEHSAVVLGGVALLGLGLLRRRLHA